MSHSQLALFVSQCEQPLLGRLLLPPLAYYWDAKPAVPAASLPQEVWSYELNPGDTYISFCKRKPDNRDVRAMMRNLDPAALRVVQEGDHYFLCCGTTRLARSSRNGATAASRWASNPTGMTVESPVILVRETADEQNFVALATLTAAK